MTLTAPEAQHPAGPHRFEILIDAIADYAIYMLDAQGFITTWNTGAQRIKGYNSVEIVGQHFSRFFSQEDQTRGLPEYILETARKTGRHEGEGWRTRKDGSRFWSSAVLQAIRDEKGTLVGFAKITRDVTERMVAQRSLQESERRFRMLVQSVVDYAIYMLDPSGVVTSWNTGAERLKGYSAAEIVGHHFSKFYSKEDRAKGLPARVLETAAREGRYEAEGWRFRKDGSRFWASVVVDAIRNDSGGLEGFAKVTRDITERRAAQEAVRQSERQFRLLVAGVTDYAIYMLDPNGIITSWNTGAQRIKQYNADEVVGHHFSRFYTERDRAAGVPARALYTATQEGRFEAEGWRVRKDGTMFWASVVLDAIRDEQNELIGFAKITRDISERRNAQIALEEAQAQRAHTQKIDALGQLTGGVAHDFNNLLMVISGNIPAVKRKVADDPKATRAAEAIEIASRRGAALTRQLLTFSRRQIFNPTSFGMNDRIEACRTMLESYLGSSMKLVSTIGAEVRPVKVDANELELAIVNLALNARDAMSPGGVITITAENVTLSKSDTQANIEGEFVALRISDTGSGIAPDVLAKVFDPFFTTKRADKGTGLGLSQVHGFAHQSGGTVAIESELGRGTTVTLYLPAANENETDSRVEPEMGPAGSGTVLVAEDNPEVADVTVSMLEQLGYEVHLVGSADAAVEAIDSKEFDLVVSDIVMPGALDGVMLARTLRERKPTLPVLLVTGYNRSGTESDAEFTILRKPFQLEEISRTASRMIAAAKQPENTNIVKLRIAKTRDS